MGVSTAGPRAFNITSACVCACVSIPRVSQGLEVDADVCVLCERLS